jgi:hypothetical protein
LKRLNAFPLSSIEIGEKFQEQLHASLIIIVFIYSEKNSLSRTIKITGTEHSLAHSRCNASVYKIARCTKQARKVAAMKFLIHLVVVISCLLISIHEIQAASISASKRSETIAYLREFGYLPKTENDEKISDEKFVEALKELQVSESKKVRGICSSVKFYELMPVKVIKFAIYCTFNICILTFQSLLLVRIWH